MNFSDLYRNVISKGLCARCGICSGACPVKAIDHDQNEFPFLKGKCTDCGLCSRICPGGEFDFPRFSQSIFGSVYDPHNLQGHVQKTVVAFSKQDLIREAGSSGGVVRGLLSYLLEKGEINGAVVVGMYTNNPIRFRGVLATTNDQIVNCAKSIYCITPAMQAIQKIKRLKGRFAVVGLPCQVHGLRKWMAAEPKQAKKIAYILGLYCRMSIEPDGHHTAIRVRGIDLSDVVAFEFRGKPWPSALTVTKRNGEQVPLHQVTKRTIINVMFWLYGCKRCALCIDTMNEYADLSFGDFWHMDYTGFWNTLTQCTLVSLRTDRGADLMADAAREGVLVFHELPPEKMSKRTLNVSETKRNLAFVKIERARHQEAPYPDYEFITRPKDASWYRKELSHRGWRLLRIPLLQKWIVKIFSSPKALFLERIREKRHHIFRD